MFTAIEEDLKWGHKALERRILLKVVGTIGGDSWDLKELRVLNRVLRWQEWGIAYEADTRHAELLNKALGPGAASRSTPGVKQGKASDDKTLPLAWEEVKLFRTHAARANYLGMDRPDLAFSAKELCRRMSCPTMADMDAVRLVYRFPWQRDAGLSVYVDTDFAGCYVTRKSTSGGVLYRGAHTVKHWSTTQKCITLSSGEAELSGVVKGVAEGLGAQALAADTGLDLALCARRQQCSNRDLSPERDWPRGASGSGPALGAGPFEGRCVCIVQGLGRAQPSRLVYKAFGPASDGPPARADWGHPRAWLGRDCTSGNRRGWAHTLPEVDSSRSPSQRFMKDF